ncbi:DegT/DnrJ/EryC1/StrS family aminotransferase [Brevundimonas subvibrioides]|uniref:DegT/DnrJ/EryC1/StrS aminotransferase n=1 Tax=Brevundimonas subvibrioides (strain ATCC 15264 / DSM 4735 / LMG 14903 / NBRC 16000 / CB 81) TaxID=633149 RepID=D9QLZ5_BRESC|nr:aminotransferase class I/II-fold pyridoxal phosphate-dependent enzyme [Brevundimonas subvibrioides]ADL00079.1 DegT/DnrJ/EryC1/StrS aminotransferase [Brevundimonas subvibrioides ATCC 15264]
MRRIPLSAPDLGPDDRARLIQTFDDGWVSSAGPVVEAFEQAFADHVGLAHATATSSGTAALHLALHMLDLKPGDAVIAPTLTFIGGVAPIVHAGARPLFVDSSPDDWNLDPALLDAAFAKARTEGLTVRAIVPADLYGQGCDIGAIGAVAASHGVPVILDSAEAVGAMVGGRHAGHGASAAGFSFNGNKIITTGGGGMLASDDGALIARARSLAAAARIPAVHYEHAEVGFNYRMLSLSAALGLSQLPTLEAKVNRRRAIFDHYRGRLGGRYGVDFAPEAPGRRHTRWLSVMVMDREITGVSPERLRLALAAADIEARPVWKPMHLQPAFRDAPVLQNGVAETLFAGGLCLPSGSSLTGADIDRVCDVIEATLDA